MTKELRIALDTILGPDFGKSNDGDLHPDTVVANSAARAERERIAKMIEGFCPGQIRMAAGEMTAQEMRTVQAVQRWWVSAIRHGPPHV